MPADRIALAVLYPSSVGRYALGVLGTFNDYRRIFVEVTKAEHNHGGAGWEFGTCLWSPARNKAGSDLYRLMREVAADDLVLHLLHDSWNPGESEHRFVGSSFAQAAVEVRQDEPTEPGAWARQSPYYRVPLRNYQSFLESLSLAAFIPLFDAELREDLATRPIHFPFTLYNNERDVRLRQGGYLNDCTPALFDAIKQAIGDLPPAPEAKAHARTRRVSADREYKETKRLASERYAFARNPSLVRDARAIRGLQCEACDFDFEKTYGEFGRDYIECHHVDPLGGRREPLSATKVRDVRMLCANCHRVVHRQHPPMHAEELRAHLGLPPRSPIPDLDDRLR